LSEVLRPIFTSDSERKSAPSNLRPKDAATLVVVDRSRGQPKLLMGRRKASLKFMPGLYVFPGGRVDKDDARMPHVGNFTEGDLAKMLARTSRMTERRLRAMALAAIRETYEEAGVLLGRRLAPARVPNVHWEPFVDHGVTPDLSALMFICRAITPPRRPRRFDTRFFLAEAEAIAITLPPEQRPDTDLEAIEWLSIDEARERPLPFITAAILKDIEARLALSDWATRLHPVPFYFSKGEKHLKDMI
jgi:8-oxo-dGTP pyrophosphatase MutT (NUDIX family)